MTNIAILGAGAFGTALGISLASDGNQVTLVARSGAHVDEMARTRTNAARLPGVPLPDLLSPATEIPGQTDLVLAAVPTQALAETLRLHASRLRGKAVVSCNKGVDLSTGAGPTGIIAANSDPSVIAALSGPGFAADIARGLPTALTLACSDDSQGRALQHQLSTRTLRLYRTTDVAGVEIGGALKNVIAIASGLAMGGGLGESARAAIMTRGYAELARFALSRGARPETLSGLSGLGDLVLTCTSEKSRNYSCGLSIARGEGLPTGKTVEGVSTAKVVSNIGKTEKIDLPITHLVNAIVSDRLSIEEARDQLLSRPLKEE